MRKALLVAALLPLFVAGASLASHEFITELHPWSTTVRLGNKSTTVHGTVTDTDPVAHPTTVTVTEGTTTSPPPPPSYPNTMLGVSTGWIGDHSTAQEYDGLAEVGADMVRIDCSWALSESVRGVFNWTSIDVAVNLARARGLQVMCVPWQTPGWANGGQGASVPPTNPADYGNFVRALATRYVPLGVLVYEVWNEPNLPAFFASPDPVKYAALVREAYAAVKFVSTGTVVLAGALSPVGGYNDGDCNGTVDSGTRPDGAINPTNFLERMYASGISSDGISVHPYEGGGIFVVHPCNTWRQMAWTSPSMRSFMEAHGDGSDDLWATEWGATLAWTGGSEAEQARRVGEAIDAWRTYTWAGPMMLFNYHDHGELFGLTRADWTRRPSWDTYRSRSG